MIEFRNLDGRRVCDINGEKTMIEIVNRGCVTRITANTDGTLNIENVPNKAA